MVILNMKNTIDLIETMGVAAFLGEMHADNGIERPSMEELMKQLQDGMTFSRFERVLLTHNETQRKALTSAYMAGRHNAFNKHSDADVLAAA